MPKIWLLVCCLKYSTNYQRHHVWSFSLGCKKEEGVALLISLALDWDIQDKLDSKLGLGVSNDIIAIGPFVPLGPTELKTILIQQLKNLVINNLLKKIRMTSKLAKIWTSAKYIEYYKLKKSSKSNMMFSSRGAILKETHQLPTLQSELLTCFPSSLKNLLL